MNALVVFLSFAIFVDKGLSLLFVVAIFAHFVFVGAKIKWRRSDIEVAFLYNPWHKTIEECHDKRVDVRAIDIGVGHDDNLIVAQFVDIGFFIVFTFYAKAHANTLDDVHYRLCFKHLMPLHFFYIEDFTLKRKDGLRVAVASLFGRATGRIALDEENLRGFWVFIRAIGKFSWQSTARHWVFSLNAFACFSGSDTCRCGQYHLIANKLSFFWMFFEIIAKSLSHGLLHSARHFAITQFCFGLSFELRLGHLDRDNSRESFAEVFASYFDFRFLYLLRYNGVVIGIVFQRTR